jgi:hypothetical protein
MRHWPARESRMNLPRPATLPFLLPHLWLAVPLNVIWELPLHPPSFCVICGFLSERDGPLYGAICSRRVPFIRT